MKTCKRCLLEKTDDEFAKQYRNKKRTRFNLRTYCRPCDKEINKEYRIKNKEILFEKRKTRIVSERERVGVAVKRGFAVVSVDETKKREACRHRAILMRKKGIIKPTGYCQFCGIDSLKLEMHHANYDFPECVVFLCRGCHLKMHWNVLNER